VSNDDVWRNLKQRLRRGADPDQDSSSGQSERDRGPIDPIGWNWASTERDPAGRAFESDDSSTAAHSKSVAPVGYRAEVPGSDERSVDRLSVEESVVDRVGPVRRPARLRQATGYVVPRTASAEDLERMAHQLLFGPSDRPTRRSSGSTLIAETVEISGAKGGPIDRSEVAVPLSEVAGVGATVAERLALAGYDNAQALARIADDRVDDLAHEIGTFPGRVHRWVQHARELTNHPTNLAPPSG
jgi:predicted flap endonuclease-1-like 5' DNA nuclease